MHRCLQIPEVSRAVFDQLDKRTLAALARTCQALRDHALDVLWYSQRSLLPLLKCLPPHIWDEIVGDKQPLLRIRHPITPEDWTRVDLYRYRVKHLSVDTAELDFDFFRSLELCAPEPFLMPNLRTLAWRIEEGGFFPFCRQFLAPNLYSVTLVVQDCTPDLSMLATLPRSHPRLTKIDIDMPASTSSVRIVSQAVCEWKFIKKLSAMALDENALVHVSSLPQLADLQIHSHVPPVASERLATGQAFPALRHLMIGSDTIQSAFSLVAHVSSPHLRHLHITTQQCAPAFVWEESFQILTRLPCRPYLTSFSLCQRSTTPPILRTVLDKYILTPPNLAPLLSLPHLADLVLQPLFGLDLDDATLHRMAAAWPLLENLELGAEHPTPRPPRPTLRALLSLTAHCPRLHALQLALDASDPPPPPVQCVPRPHRTHRLAHLHTGPSSPVGSPARVAAFLSGVFAAIEFAPRRDVDSAVDRAWDEVQRLFPVFRAVRAEEAKCWGGDDAWDSDSDSDDEDEEDEDSDDDG